MFTAKVNQRRRNLVHGCLRLESLETRRLFAGDLGSGTAVDPVGAVTSNDATQAAEVAVQESSSVSLVSNDIGSHDPLDTNGDGRVTANDALLVINYMGRQDSRSEGEDTPPTNLDANGDGRVSALDALVIINRLGRIEPEPAEPGGKEPVRFTNPVNPYDVDESGNVTAADVDVIYKALERYGSRKLKDLNPDNAIGYVDVNADGMLSSLDALAVINQLGKSNPDQTGLNDGLSADLDA